LDYVNIAGMENMTK